MTRSVCVRLQWASAAVVAALLTARGTFAQQSAHTPASPPGAQAPAPTPSAAPSGTRVLGSGFDGPAQGAYGTTPYPYVPTPHASSPVPPRWWARYYAVPTPPTERNRPALIVGGIVVTTMGGAAVLGGVYLAAWRRLGTVKLDNDAAALALTLGGVAGIVGGVAMIVVGADEVPVGPGPAAALAPRVVLAPTRAGVAISF